MVSAAMSELGHLGAEAHAKALALTRGIKWELLDQVGRAEMVSAAMSELRPRAHAKVLAQKRGVEWEKLDLAGRAEMESAAMSEVGQLGTEAHAKALTITRGVEWDLLDQVGRKEMTSTAMSEKRQVTHLRKRTEATEAYAWKIAQTEGKDWGSMWLLTQESYRDETETICQNCYVGGSAPKTQKDAFQSFDWGSASLDGRMMMIAFITVRSSLVPLIDGLCAQIYFRFEISVVCVHIFCFSFSEEKIC